MKSWVGKLFLNVMPKAEIIKDNIYITDMKYF